MCGIELEISYFMVIKLRSEQPNSQVLFDVAVVTRKMNDQPGSIAALKQTIEIDNHLAVAHFLLGIVYCQNKKTMGDAPACFSRVNYHGLNYLK